MQLSKLIGDFGRRQANQVAHNLARASRFHASTHDIEFIPICIYASILKEMQ